MVSTRYALHLALALCFAAEGFAQQTNATPPRPASRGSVLVQIDPTQPGKGLNVVASIKVSAASRWPVRFSVSVVNLLEEEVLLTVEGIELANLRYELERQVPEGTIEGLPEGAIEEWPGSGVTHKSFFPDNTGLLKRLHACQYKDGEARPCGCAVARIQGAFGDEDDPLNLKTVIGAHGRLTIPIRGYFRANGKAFAMDVEVPFTVVEQQPRGRQNDATRTEKGDITD